MCYNIVRDIYCHLQQTTHPSPEPTTPLPLKPLWQDKLSGRNRRRDVGIRNGTGRNVGLVQPVKQHTHQVPKHHAARCVQVGVILLAEVVQRRVGLADGIDVRRARFVEVDVHSADVACGCDGGSGVLG